ncbi:unnamed protein product [Trypanosoma congolense IL3000]|uniref:WGS project CAEQ00000000 data, annotated contig 447 n=1 Tax=Trypanosoma congolense (strain IL3000) TaxID=1068625 RepID=F9WG02_TRYCI|nr:unnamed protein product [Trypanosoma congolense IL3000]
MTSKESEGKPAPKWTMDSFVDDVLLQGIQDKENINLFHFLKNYYRNVKPDLRRFTLSDFLDKPEQCIEEVDLRECILRRMPHMLRKLQECMFSVIRYLRDCGVRTIQDWTAWQHDVHLENIPRIILDQAVRETRKRSHSQKTYGSRPVQNIIETSSHKTNEITSIPSLQRQGLTMNSELEEIFRKACETWDNVYLVDLLSEEYGKMKCTHNPTVSIADFLEYPSQCVQESRLRVKLLKELPEKLQHLKERIFRDLKFLRNEGITTVKNWTRHPAYHDQVSVTFRSILATAGRLAAEDMSSEEEGIPSLQA